MENELIKDLETKYELASKSRNKLLENIHSLEESTFYFISYIQAVKTSWFYFARWVNNNPKINDKSKDLIFYWENKYLSDQEKKSWNLINHLRNTDTHESPVNLNFKLESKLLSYNGNIISFDGNILKHSFTTLIVHEDTNVYNIIDLTKICLLCFRKLIQFVSDLNNKI